MLTLTSALTLILILTLTLTITPNLNLIPNLYISIAPLNYILHGMYNAVQDLPVPPASCDVLRLLRESPISALMPKLFLLFVVGVAAE